jgi:hypothetical protein
VTGKGTAEGKSELISIGVIVDFTARTVQGFEGQLGKEPLAGSIACCNLPQLRNVCGTQWRVIILLAPS